MSLDYRTWGKTTNCKGCRFWSEMVAQSAGNGIEAMCLAHDSQFRGKMMPSYGTCAKWNSGHHGAVDDPSGEIGRLYELEETSGEL